VTETPTIRLGQFLKLVGLVATGGEAKYLIQTGQVEVNDEVETRRRRQLVPGDIVTLGDWMITVELDDSPASPDEETE
jgi:ribosome-associated protein